MNIPGRLQVIVNPTTSGISLLLSEAKAKPRPRCNNKDILRVSGV